LLKSRAWDTWVSLAGPAMNVPIILIISLCFKAGLLPPTADHLASVSLGFLLQLEVSAVILNLLPVPPLDGFQALAPWLPEDVRERLHASSNAGMFVLFIALWYIQPLNEGFWNLVYFISDALGVPRYMGY